MLTNWLEHIEFAYPWALFLLLLIPVLAVAYNRKKRELRATMTVSTVGRISNAGGIKGILFGTLFWLRMIALGCLIVAMARPREKFVEQQTSGEGIDIVLCFDISGSMTEQDFKPNRLEAAKQVAARFVQQRPGDRIGVTIFSSLSFTLCPVTADHNVVLQQIVNNIQPGLLQADGTAIGAGLATSVDRLRKSHAKSKVIILLTDGVDYGGAISPDVATEMAQTYHIKVYTIGIGSDKEVDEVQDGAMGPARQKRKLDFNPQLLQNMAKKTGGQYFQASDNMALEKIYSDINQLEKSKVEVVNYNHYVEHYLPWLLLGLMFLSLEIFLRYGVLKKFP